MSAMDIAWWLGQGECRQVELSHKTYTDTPPGHGFTCYLSDDVEEVEGSGSGATLDEAVASAIANVRSRGGERDRLPEDVGD